MSALMVGGRAMRFGLAGALALAALAVHRTAGPFGHDLLAEIAGFAILAMSLDLLGGYAGLVSFGHAAFLGIGAYAFGYFAVLLGWSPAAAMLAAVAAGTMCAAAAGALAVRTGGVFFIMVTLALSMIFHAWAYRNPAFNGSDGLGGIPRVPLSAFGLDSNEPAVFSAAVLGLCALVWLALEFLVQTPFGRTLAAIRQNPDRVRALGGRVYLFRLVAFALSGGLAALAGTLTAQQTGFISPDVATWFVSGDVLIAAILGGLGTLVGPVLGAALLIAVKYWLSGLTSYWFLCLGAGFVAVSLLLPDGICGRLIALAEARRPAARKAPAAP